MPAHTVPVHKRRAIHSRSRHLGNQGEFPAQPNFHQEWRCLHRSLSVAHHRCQLQNGTSATTPCRWCSGTCNTCAARAVSHRCSMERTRILSSDMSYRMTAVLTPPRRQCYVQVADVQAVVVQTTMASTEHIDLLVYIIPGHSRVRRNRGPCAVGSNRSPIGTSLTASTPESDLLGRTQSLRTARRPLGAPPAGMAILQRGRPPEGPSWRFRPEPKISSFHGVTKLMCK